MYTGQRWKPVGSTGTGQVDRPVGLPVGSRFFDRPVKPVDTPVKFSFLLTKRHLSPNRSIHTYFVINETFYQRWSPRGRPGPRGHILMSLASKVKSLASKPQVLENCPALGSKTAIFFELLKFCRSPKKIFENVFFLEIAWKDLFFFFFGRTLAPVSLVLGLGPEHSCSWPREGLSSKGQSLALDFFVSLALASSIVFSTLPLFFFNKPQLLKTLVEWLQAVTKILMTIKTCTSRGIFGGESIVPCPPPLWATAQSKKG